ncbi:MAG TPA: ACT domain-containing protein, partial [Microbacteriaceae bacterium]|nr:ACT domain-containing protein [Microbacteriaceae bacterium]
IDVIVQGEITEHNVGVLELAALKGFFTQIVNDPVSYVNAPHLAQQRGIQVRLLTEPSAEDYRNVITLRGVQEDGGVVSISGTLAGQKQVQKIVEINGYDLELTLSNHLIVFEYDDRPGVVASYGTILGEAGINIENLQVSRDDKMSRALSVLTIDANIGEEVVAQLREAIGASDITVVEIFND